MNGIEHYQEAERLLDKVQNAEKLLASVPADQVKHIPTAIPILIAAAQAHATLALAAATALRTTHHYVGDSQEVTDWGRIVQPDAFTGKPCDDGCVDEGRDGCPPRCVAARTATTDIEVECPF